MSEVKDRDSAKERMWDAVRGLSKEMFAYPGFREWQNKKMAYVLADDLRDLAFGNDDLPQEFHFSEELERKYKLVTLYVQLVDVALALKDVEYYFRRYPFHDLPVSHDRHLAYICEMYFAKFYAFRARLKNYLNALNDAIPDGSVSIGKLLRIFDRDFDTELRNRNQIHHHRSIDDIDTSYVFITGVLPKDQGWASESKRAYRRITREWVARVRNKSARLEEYLEAIATASLTHSEDLRQLSELGSEDD